MNSTGSEVGNKSKALVYREGLLRIKTTFLDGEIFLLWE